MYLSIHRTPYSIARGYSYIVVVSTIKMSQQQQGRCSASHRARVATGLLLCVLFLPLVTAKTATHLVGDSSGWTFNVESWTNGKKFKAGDILGIYIFSTITFCRLYFHSMLYNIHTIPTTLCCSASLVYFFLFSFL